MKCVTNAWDSHEQELRNFLRSRLSDSHLAEDLLQDVFVKALANGGPFCHLENPRAWLFRVARNRLIDYQRTNKIHDEVDDQLGEANDEAAPVVNLSQCLPTALLKLSPEDKEIIELCDLEGMNQSDYAQLKDISLTGAKSRIQRARRRLKSALDEACKIVFDEQGNVCCFDPKCK